MMKKGFFISLLNLYRKQLLEDIIPFWMKYSLDKKNGGYYTCLDRDGSIYDRDKYAWMQAREIWMFSKLYNELEKVPEWLEAAKSGVKFLCKYFFNSEGRMYFAVTYDGKPLYKPWSIFSETFAIIGLAEYAKASGDEDALKMAQDIYGKVIKWVNTPGYLSSHTYPKTRKVESHAIPMILLLTTQELSHIVGDSRFNKIIDECLDKILYRHTKDKEKALFENISPERERLDSPQGRCINPGHAIESAWVILQEGQKRNDKRIIERALKILDWSLQWGWDKEFGGLFYFVDSEGKPPEQLEWDMKLWWPHTEALYALLLAFYLSGKQNYLTWYKRVHDWTFNHFPDPDYGEWFGYLNREGRPSLYLKGSKWKGFFHLPRALLFSLKLLEKMKIKSGNSN